jgi:N-acetylmuramoyl-L-alanine amidase
MNSKELLWLSINSYHEARGEPFEGIVAVCHVVLNRTLRRSMGVKEVVLQPWQFSWANTKPLPGIKDLEGLERCMVAAEECLKEREQGITLEDADHYYADYIDKPKWADSMEHICTIGRHLFYRS